MNKAGILGRWFIVVLMMMVSRMEVYAQQPLLKSGEPPSRSLDLWPGKQVNVDSLTLDWQFNAQPAPKEVHVSEVDAILSGTVTPNSGSIIIKGAGKVYSQIYLPYAVEVIPNTFHGRIYAYADGTAILLQPSPPERPVKVKVHYWKQPDTIQLGAKRQEGDIFVAGRSPVSVGAFRLGVSDEPLRYPDGSEYYELQLSDSDSKTSVSVPVTHGAQTSLGRLSVNVGNFWPATRTAQLNVVCSADYSTNGLDTILTATIPVVAGENMFQLLERLGKQYGFSTTWADAKDHPGSAELAKTSNDFQDDNPEPTGKDQPLFETLRSRLTSKPANNEIAAEFTKISRTELGVRTTRRRAEGDQNRRLADQQREEYPRLFASVYAAEPRMYPVDARTAITAKTLIEQELHTYFLANRFNIERLPRNRQVLHDGMHLEICVVPNTTEVSGETSKTREYVVQDEKAGALLVHAIPATHAKIKDVLQKVQSLVAATDTTMTAARSYRIDLVLLEGIKDNAGAVPGSANAPGVAAEKPAAVDPKEFGLTTDDLRLFGFTSVAKLGSGVVNMVAEAGSSNEASVSLSEFYHATLALVDYRKPYIIVRGALEGVGIPDGANMKVTKSLLENTLYLEPGKPTLLGVTNFKQALILIVKVRE